METIQLSFKKSYIFIIFFCISFLILNILSPEHQIIYKIKKNC